MPKTQSPQEMQVLIRIRMSEDANLLDRISTDGAVSTAMKQILKEMIAQAAEFKLPVTIEQRIASVRAPRKSSTGTRKKKNITEDQADSGKLAANVSAAQPVRNAPPVEG